jgi:hypothetical protein
LNLQQGSAAEREPKQQPSVGDTTAVDDQRPRDSGRTVESLIEDMKRASAVDEETPQGQYNLAGKLLEDSLRLIDQGIASKEEIEKLQKESAEWRRKSALQGYLPAMLLLQGNEKELGAKEKLVWNLVRLHADMLVKRAKRDVTEMHPRNYYVIGFSARRLNASEVRDAVKEAERRISRFAMEGYLPSSKGRIYGDSDLQLWEHIKSDCIKHGNLPEEIVASFVDSDSEQNEDATNPSPLAITVVKRVSPSGDVAGQTIEFPCSVTNISEEAISIPEKDFAGSKRNVLGTLQSWIERLGPVTEIPSIPSITAKSGNRYAAGGGLMVSRGAILEPGGSEIETRKLRTTGYPSGQYRYHIELTPYDSSLPKAGAVVQFSLN